LDHLVRRETLRLSVAEIPLKRVRSERQAFGALAGLAIRAMLLTVMSHASLDDREGALLVQRTAGTAKAETESSRPGVLALSGFVHDAAWAQLRTDGRRG